MADRHQLHASHCDAHGKRLFSDRDTAKQAIRRQHSKGMRPYACDLVVGHWHIGHLPLAVLTGRKTAHQVYGRQP